MFIIVFSFVGVEKMTEVVCGNQYDNAKKICLKNHIDNVLDPDDKYYMYVNGKPKYGAGAVSGVNGKITHFQNMINAFNTAKADSNEGAKYCAGMTDNQPKIDCLAEKKTQTAAAATAATASAKAVESAHKTATTPVMTDAAAEVIIKEAIGRLVIKGPLVVASEFIEGSLIRNWIETDTTKAKYLALVKSILIEWTNTDAANTTFCYKSHAYPVTSILMCNDSRVTRLGMSGSQFGRWQLKDNTKLELYMDNYTKKFNRRWE